jgi:hypothetical protein
VLLAIGLEEDTVAIKDQVIYVNPGTDNRYCAGLEFLELYKQVNRVLKKFVYCPSFGG